MQNAYRYSGCFLFGILLFNFYNCAEPAEGCIQIAASNFDVSADIDCCRKEGECCCTFPAMSLNFFYKLNTGDTLANPATNFKIGRYYPLENSLDSIRIDSFQLFVANTRPLNSTLEDSLQVIENIRLLSADGLGGTVEASYPDNLALIDFENFRYTLGTYQSTLTYDKFNYSLGIPEYLARVEPNDVLDAHPLGGEYTVLYVDEDRRYISGRVGFRLKRAQEERFVVHEITNSTQIEQELSLPTSIEKGSELRIVMRINTLDVFKGIIFDVPNEDIGLIINDNLISSISILE